MILSVMIAPEEWMALKAFTDLGTTVNNTYVSLGERFTADRTSFAPNPPTILQVSMLTPNAKPPFLLGGIADLNSRFLRVMFSEQVNISSVNVSGFSVTFTNIMTGLRQTHTLTGGATSFDGTNEKVKISLLIDDFNTISLTGSNTADFFVTIAANSVEGISGLPNSFQENVAFQFLADASSPRIGGFTLNFSNGTMCLVFTEVVSTNPGDIDYSRIYVTNGGFPLTKGSYNLTGSVIVSESVAIETTVALWLPASTLSMIAADADTCSSVDNCFMFWGNGSFRDLSNNMAIVPVFSVQASNVLADTTRPSLTLFSVDLSNGMLNVTFSEIVDLTSFLVSFLTFTNSDASQQHTVNGLLLERSSATSFDSKISITLASDSLNFAKFLQTPRLAVWSTAVHDVAGNAVVVVSVNMALRPSVVIPDRTPPQLLGFSPGDPATREIVLTFNEFVSAASWRGYQLSLTLQVNAGDFVYTNFVTGTLALAVSDCVTYTFSDTDYTSTFSSQYMEAFGGGSIALRAGEGLVRDLSGNLLPATDPIVFSALPPVPPSLLGFNLDMNEGRVQITFSKAVSIVSTPGTAQVQFLNSSDADGQIFNVVDGMIHNATGPLQVWELVLTNADLSALKLDRELCTSRADTFMKLLPGLAEDRNRNQVQLDSNIVQVSTYTADTASPEVAKFKFDLNRGQLVLHFSEPILVSSLNFSLFHLASSDLSSQQRVSIPGSLVVNSTQFDSLLVVSVTEMALNSIKFHQSICTDPSNCYLHHTSNSFSDLSGNPALKSATDGLAPSFFFEDITPPTLSSFSLNLNSGLTILFFSEPILIFSFQPSSISAHSSGFTHQLDGASLTTTESFNTILHLALRSDLLNQLKLLSSFGSVLTLSISSSAAIDTSSLPISSSANLAPSSFESDTTPPTILQFKPSPGPVKFTLVFDELVAPSTFTASNLLSFRLKNQRGQFDYTDLSSAEVSGGISDRLTLTFPASETRFTDSTFLSLYALSVNGGSICFHLAPSFISDVLDNPYSGDLLVVYTNTTNLEYICRGICPNNTFESLTGCQNCHSQCAGSCRGPTRTDCESCLENAVEVDGGTECVPLCPFGMTYNSESEACQLTL